MINIDDILAKNSEKNEKRIYNPTTGEGCYGDRVQLTIEDAPYQHLFIPADMTKYPVYKELVEKGTIAAILGDDYTEDNYNRFWISFCELRIKYDYEYYAISYQTITDKLTAQFIPFLLNNAQRRILAVCERMRVAGRPIYLILLKARQMGGSTFIQMYMNWIQMVHQKNWNSVVCAHVKDASQTVREMYDRCIANMPKLKNKVYTIKNASISGNIKVVPQAGCKITIGTAQEPDSVRSQDAKMVHFTEIAFYPNTEKMQTEALIASITSSIPTNVPNVLIAYESTANGVGDYFYNQWNSAESGESSFVSIFNPWYLLEIYREEFNGEFHGHTGSEKIKGTVSDFVSTMNEYELQLFENIECTLEHINWYRGKKKSAASEMTMKQEYPSTALEAFQSTGKPVFKISDIELMRGQCKPPIAVGDLVSSTNIAAARFETRLQKLIFADLKFIEDEQLLSEIKNSDPSTIRNKERNKLKIWEYPDTTQKITNRYIVSLDPAKGTSEGADNAVVRVFDRYWKMYGGKTELVAQLITKEDKDIVVYKATQIAKWYNDALFVPESNTIESSDRYNEGEFIFDIISDIYNNLYCRSSPEDIRQGIPPKWGWHTNKNTKPMVIANYTAYLREQAYVERDEQCLNEARTYETDKSGKMNAKAGCHDDILMATMIALQIDSELPMPTVIDENRMIRRPKNGVESDF
jgi:hypothetical protein